MIKKGLFLLMATLIFSQAYIFSFAQTGTIHFGGGGAPEMKATDELNDEQRKEITKYLTKNIKALTAKGLLPKFGMAVNGVTGTASLLLPIRQAPGFNDTGFYGIYNYVDEDKRYPGYVLDYNCGTRSYDNASGYNHAGTDFAIWPFPWNKMDHNAVVAQASADGTIIGKQDGNYDRDCAMCTACNWNAVYVEQTDGSICWYGHLKSGSLTTKNIGDNVVAGEFLGVVGSSGSSTSPHLHLEIYSGNAFSTLIDPWEGSCNAAKNKSWWKTQQAYYLPSILKIATHNHAPVSSQCYDGEHTNFSNNFIPGDTLFLGEYFRDQQTGTSASVKIFKPDNTLWGSSTLNFSQYYSLSWWYEWFILPNKANCPLGNWTMQVEYNGQILKHTFALSATMPLKFINFSAELAHENVLLNWQTAEEINTGYFNIQRSTDGLHFTNVGKINAAGNNKPITSYQYKDPLANQININKFYYRLEEVDKDGRNNYSNVSVINLINEVLSFNIYPNPVQDELHLAFHGTNGIIAATISGVDGKTVIKKQIDTTGNGSITIQTSKLAPGVYFVQVKSNKGISSVRKFIKW